MSAPFFPAGTWATDWEFSREEDSELPRLVCVSALNIDTGQKVSLFGDEIGRHKQAPWPTGPDAAMLAYSSGAEGSCFAVAGWQHPVNIIDPYGEHLLDLNGRPDRYEGDTQLLEALRRHDLPTRSHEHKEAMRDLARFRDPRTLSATERRDLQDYNMEDNYSARDLYRAQCAKGLINLDQALWRGRFLYLNGANIQHTGLPVDIDSYDEIRAALPRFRPAILSAIDEYGIFEDGHVRDAKVAALIEQSGLADIWPLTETGKPKRDEVTWKEMATYHDSRLTDPNARRLMPLSRALSLADQFEDPAFSIGSDRRNRYWTRPMLTRTGRNSPSPKENLLGAAKVWRGVLSPPAGFALVEIDYSNEEIWFRAAQSGCPTSIEELLSGDVHQNTAISSGLVMADADDDRLYAARERIKPFTHGVSYGITHIGIQRQLGVPRLKALAMRRSFDRTHPTLVSWQIAAMRHAYSSRRITSLMGWSMYVHSKVGRRTLLNWLMQSLGGEVLRAAVVMLAENGFAICATAHDSIYLLIPLDDLTNRVALAQEIMGAVSEPFTGGYRIPTKAKVVLPGKRLLTPQTSPIWEWLLGLARTPKGQEWTVTETR